MGGKLFLCAMATGAGIVAFGVSVDVGEFPVSGVIELRDSEELMLTGFSGPGTLSFSWKTVQGAGLWYGYSSLECAGHDYVAAGGSGGGSGYLYADSMLRDVRVEFYGSGSHTEWFCESGFGEGYGYVANVKWTSAPDSMTIHFNTSGGSVCEDRICRPGDMYGQLPSPMREGWIFRGWFRDMLFTDEVPETEYVPFAGITLYAKWVKPLEAMNDDRFTFTNPSSVNLWEMTELPGSGQVAQVCIDTATRSGMLWGDTIYYGDTSLDVCFSGKGFVSYALCSGSGDSLSLNPPTIDGAGTSGYLCFGGKGRWRRMFHAVPDGSHVLRLSACAAFYDWIDAPRHVMAADFAFEPYGPQATLRDWTDKYRNYKCWVAGDMSRFQSQYAMDTTPKGRALHALTLLLSAREDQSLNGLLGEFGFCFREFFADSDSMLDGGLDSMHAPASNGAVDRLIAAGEPVVRAALSALESIPSDFAPFCFTNKDLANIDEDVMVDYADILYMRSVLKGALGFAYFIRGYDFSLNYSAWDGPRQKNLSAGRKEWSGFKRWGRIGQEAFGANVRDSSALQISHGCVRDAMLHGRDAVRAILGRKDGRMHFVDYDAKDPRAVARMTCWLANADAAIASLDGTPARIDFPAALNVCERRDWPDNLAQNIVVNLQPLFAGDVTRSLIPESCNEKTYQPNFDMMTDPTIAGMFPEYTKVAMWAELCRKFGWAYKFGGIEPCALTVVSDHDIVNAFEPKKAITVRGCALKDGAVAGMVELNIGKAGKKGSKVSGTLEILNGKKYALKFMDSVDFIKGPQIVSYGVRKLGTLTLKIGALADGAVVFTGVCGDYTVTSAQVGGSLANPSPSVHLDSGFDLGVAGVVSEYNGREFLPYNEPILVKRGKWQFRKAAAINWSKVKGSKTEFAISGYQDPKRPNISGVKLSYTPKTGVFKGSFKVYAIREVKGRRKFETYTMSVSGVVVGGAGYGIVTSKKPKCGPWKLSIK